MQTQTQTQTQLAFVDAGKLSRASDSYIQYVMLPRLRAEMQRKSTRAVMYYSDADRAIRYVVYDPKRAAPGNNGLLDVNSDDYLIWERLVK